MSYLLIGLAGTELTARERAWLARDEVGGVIVFTRNLEAPDQLRRLLDAVRAIDSGAVATVDQEGGRVQRIKAPATVLPPLGSIGRVHDDEPERGLELAFEHATLMASEMLALGIDLSLAPVLDIDAGSEVIGDRAFHASPDAVRALGRAYLKGMHEAGMAACGKHFPGHGSVREDTHHDVAVDGRPLAALADTDLVPFSAAVGDGLDALMMSHVCYPALDDAPAGYSARWIGEFVRKRLAFTGAIVSDDLGMAAACGVGGFQARLDQAMDAGSDFVLVCRPDDVRDCFEEVRRWPRPEDDRRGLLRRRRELEWDSFSVSPARKALQDSLLALGAGA